MTLISDDPSGWPLLSFWLGYRYSDVASLIVVLYDWDATLVPHGRPISQCTQLILLRNRTCANKASLAISIAILSARSKSPPDLVDRRSTVLAEARDWTGFIVNAMLEAHCTSTYDSSIYDHFSSLQQNSYSVGSEIFGGAIQIAGVMQMFVLGPRLILDVRKFHANLVANSGEGTGMTSIAFQGRIDVSTGGGGGGGV
ncbi:hypothetical protein K503DRAFT_788141 [Rhizopogon vinicolor AM-OR11-026]|uniref:Uncharacterized protein n=1 Tax=Rhizopogon vinicolor AM-OR11-026 TaxID=1314800 RepID=A0A1B7MEE0_9AGAM|nr:hypothetical protein K503DRAFT_788141 [Rhizopogon vinicolor AM-OR11-026]